MYHKDVFVFGTKTILNKVLLTQDAISSLPLELSWKIFSYLDDTSLRKATKVYEKWRRIIMAHKKLQNRLNFFELVIRLGSESLAKFHKRNRRIMKKEKTNNYLPVNQHTVQSMRTTTLKKRSGDDLIISTKRYKLF
ncbi:uncharacterized protein ACR2FA_004251 [Aphomia sociella]